MGILILLNFVQKLVRNNRCNPFPFCFFIHKLLSAISIMKDLCNYARLIFVLVNKTFTELATKLKHWLEGKEAGSAPSGASEG